MTVIFEKVKSIIVELTAVSEDEVVPEASLVEDLDVDSLDRVKLFEALEKEFKVGGQILKITDEDVQNLTTVIEIVELLKRKGVE
ncbi:MAG: acyl carrier protein [Proteobacteria bacterium]|nr:acyl carrier protein [Pseudomonadota bacterium]